MNGSGINNDPKMTNNPLLGRLINEEKQDIVYSSAYGKVQSAENIGTASAESFAARKAMEASRQAIQKYKNSEVVGGAFNNSGVKSWNYDGKKDAEQRAMIRENMEDGGMMLAVLSARSEKMEQVFQGRMERKRRQIDLVGYRESKVRRRRDEILVFRGKMWYNCFATFWWD